MDVLLTHGYFIHEDEKEQAIMRPYPPLGLLYISAYLKRTKLNVEVFDSTFSSFENLKNLILKKRPKVLCVYTNLVTKVNVIKLMKWKNSNDELSDIKILLGGPDVTYNYENYLNVGADALAVGEGEETCQEWCEAILTNSDISAINGLVYKVEGKIVKNPPRIKVKNVDDLPQPDRAAIDLKKYIDVWKEKHGKSTISISTQRGCPYTCKWCSTAVYGMSYRRRSASLVADEIEAIIRDYNPDSLWFVDDVFTVSHKWITALHAEFVKRGIKIGFECITRAERLNDEVLTQLKEMGCEKIWIGAESGSQRIIDEMDRRVDIDMVKEMIIRTKSFGIQTGTFVMVGYPKETIEDIELTVAYLKAAAPDNYTITIAYPIVGTGLHTQIKSDIINPDLDWQSTTDRDIDFKRSYSRGYYDHAVRYVVNAVAEHINKEQGKPWFKNYVKAKVSRTIMRFKS
jgi:anaerobic magnesium-protoporphyrin IX monomethyl ester cyclase